MNKIYQLRSAFEYLSPSYRTRLAKEAREFMFKNPGAANNSNFWRPRGADGIGLSAIQVTHAEYALRIEKIEIDL